MQPDLHPATKETSQHLVPKEGPKPKVIIENARVFDGNSLSRPTTVVISGNVIGLDTTGATERIDAKGGSLLPGLTESHAHPQEASDIQSLSRYGVTTAFSLASYHPQQNMSFNGLSGLADIHYASVPAAAPGSQHGKMAQAFNSDPSLLVAGPKDAPRWVEDQLTWKPEFFKIVAESPGLTQETLDVLVQQAHRHGKKVACHAADFASQRQAVLAGVDQIHHVPSDIVVNEDIVGQVRQQRQISVPTLSMMKAMAERPGSPGATRDYGASRDTVRRYHEAQIPILVGTDANNVITSVPFGISVHQELELLVEAGLSPVEALRSATVLPAMHWGFADRGVIAPGKRADLILIDGDPTVDIKTTRNLKRVWFAGQEYREPLGDMDS